MDFRAIVRGIWIVPVLFSQLLSAQVITGTISGTVKDSTGAVLPGTEVAVRQVETGITHAAKADAAGRFRVSELQPGNYEVTGSLAGFQTVVRSGITLTVGREAVVDFSLDVGSVSQSVTVTGEAPLVNTTNATVSGLVSQETMTSLPLNGRSLGDLASTQPGVISNLTIGSVSGSNNDIFTGGGRSAYRVVSGASSQQSTYLLDGIELTTASRGTPLNSVSGNSLGVDAVREMSVIQSTAGAQYGRAAGGVVNAVTKSGTNTFHGSVFEYLRNSKLDARDYFLDQNFDQTPYKRNQYGAGLGGPIQKDRTFFFTNYEGIRIGAANSNLGATLTKETRQGDVTDASGKFDPTKHINVDPNVVPLMNLLPLPNGAFLNNGVANFFSQDPYHVNEDYGTARVDKELSAKDSFFGRITIDRSGRTDLSPLLTPVPYEFFQSGGYVLSALSWTRDFSPTVLSTARFGYTRRNDRSWQTYTEGGSQFPNATGLDPRLSPVPGVPLGTWGIPGALSIGPGLVAGIRFVDNMFEAGDSVMINRGGHALTVGATLKRYQDNILNQSTLYGNFSWQTIQTFLTNVPFTTTQGVRSDTPGNLFGDAYRGYRQTYGSLFVQDDFQLFPNLSLNLGVRWEQIGSPREVNGKLGVFNNLYADSGVTTTFDSKAPYFTIPKALAGFSPRFGFAWSPGGTGKTVIRGGFGVYTEMPLVYMFITAPDAPPFMQRFTLNAPGLKFPFPVTDLSLLKAQAEPITVPSAFKSPHMLQWNISLERQLSEHWVVKANYLGMRGLDQMGVYNAVQPVSVLQDGRYVTPATATSQNPNLTGVRLIAPMGDQYYHAGQWVVQKQFSSGLTLNSSYTWSKNLSDMPLSNVGATNTSGSGNFIYNVQNFRGDKSLAPIHIAHNWITTVTYELPFGTGRHWGNSWNGVPGTLLGGWSVNATQSARTGLPSTISMTAKQSRCQAQSCVERPDLISGGNNNPNSGTSIGCTKGTTVIPAGTKLGTTDLYFDPCQFAVQPLGYFGNVGRDTLIGPGLWNLDFSLSKETAVREGKDLTFRAEFFNIFNHPNFSPAGSALFTNAAEQLSSTAGKIRSLNTAMRQIQFALKFTF